MTDDRHHETEEERRLRRLLAERTTPGTLDADVVIRRSRTRRRGGVVVTTAVSALAVVGIGAVALGGLGGALPHATTADAGSQEATLFGAEGGASESDLRSTPANGVLCGAVVSEVAPSTTGLVLTPDFEDVAAADGTEQRGTVTLSNTGAEAVHGSASQSPVMSLAEDGVTVWHGSTEKDLLGVVVELEPGESMRLEASYLPVRCEEDQLRADLPALEPGTYLLRAVIEVVPDDGSPPELVTGPAQEITLR